MKGVKSLKDRYRWLLCVAAVVLLLDQITKWLVVRHIPHWKAVPVIPGFFDLVNVRNRGAAFGFLNRSDIEWQFWLFFGATAIAVAAILWLVHTMKENAPFFLFGMGLILGGASGNFLDRLRYRAVVDFLDIYWKSWHWPAFNVADMGICIGAFLVAISMVQKKRTE